MKETVFNIQKFSLHDGPGIRTTVFLKGCPLRCKWCANPESQNPEIEFFRNKENCLNCQRCIRTYPELFNRPEQVGIDSVEILKVCPNKALFYEGDKKSIEEIVNVCLQDEPFYEESGGGVTLSGGEPLIHPEFTRELILRLKDKGIETAVETTGAVPSKVFREIGPLFDLILYDVKHYDSEKHKEGTGLTNAGILENLKWMIENGLSYLARIPVIPGFNDSLEDAQGFSKLFNSIGVDRVQLLPFHQFGEKKYLQMDKDYVYKDKKALYPEELEEYRKIFLDNDIEAFF